MCGRNRPVANISNPLLVSTMVELPLPSYYYPLLHILPIFDLSTQFRLPRSVPCLCIAGNITTFLSGSFGEDRFISALAFALVYAPCLHFL